jgi:hypothetical protein|nr:MAG TPA: hypothetical protein [Crassvirales sp.]
MNIFINEAMLEKYNLSLAEALILITSEIAEKNNTTLDYILRVMKLKNYILSDGSLNPLCSNILKELSKNNTHNKINKVDLSFIKSLQNIFPEGKKEGTNIYWRGNSSEVRKKLEMFIAKNSHITKDDILDAAKRYVQSFNGNYSYMRTLKYFILKNENKNGEINYTSDLLTFIENKSNEEQSFNFSNSELR